MTRIAPPDCSQLTGTGRELTAISLAHFRPQAVAHIDDTAAGPGPLCHPACASAQNRTCPMGTPTNCHCSKAYTRRSHQPLTNSPVSLNDDGTQRNQSAAVFCGDGPARMILDPCPELKTLVDDVSLSARMLSVNTGGIPSRRRLTQPRWTLSESSRLMNLAAIPKKQQAIEKTLAPPRGES
jgi:hypothetical protein